MRELIILVFALAACDGSFQLRAQVLDGQTQQPIANAEVWLADRVMNEQLDGYLKGRGKLGEYPTKTDVEGRFRAGERLAGPGHHDIWIVIRAPGYQELSQRVWSGSGFHSPDGELHFAMTRSEGRKP